MKILQINCVYKSGSTGKIVYDIHTGLKNSGVESVVCYGLGPKVNEENVYRTLSKLHRSCNSLATRFTGVKYGGCLLSTKKLIGIIKREKPDIVHLHCINGYMVNIYKLVGYLKKSGIKTVLTLHAEFMHTGNCGHAFECEKWKTGCGKCPRLKAETKSFFIDGTHKSWVKMKKAYDGFEKLRVVSVSPWLMERAKQSPILADKNHSVVFNGLDTDVFKLYDTCDLRVKHNLTDEKIVFHATPLFSNDINHLKGGYYMLKLAKLLEKENVKIIVAGGYDEGIDIPSNMIMLGKVGNQEELAKYYSMADITVLTSKRETFSMVVAESLSCGTPTVGFYAGGPEQIAIKEYSDFVEYGDVEALCQAVINSLAKPHSKEEIARAAEITYSKKSMVDGYKQIYKDLWEEK